MSEDAGQMNCMYVACKYVIMNECGGECRDPPKGNKIIPKKEWQLPDTRDDPDKQKEGAPVKRG
jgi:hypothetical protein